MNIREKKIGYVSYSPDLSHPGDRRRFPYFASRNNIPFEIADTSRTYDIILMTALSNLSKWMRYKKRHPHTKFLFEMTDSLFFDSDIFNTLFKGVGRYILNKESHLNLNHKGLLRKWLTTADVIICSNNKLREYTDRYNNKSIVSADYMQHEVKARKEDFSTGPKLKLVWEGQSVVISHFSAYMNLLKKLSTFCELHFITDETFLLKGGLLKKDTRDFIGELPIQTHFHKWEMHKNYQELIQYDCGFIPIDPRNKLGWHKPSNKLLSFWFAGLPTFTSGTPAYKHLMEEAGFECYSNADEQWLGKLKLYHSLSPHERKDMSNRSFEYACRNFSEEKIDQVWLEIFETAF